MGIAGSQIDDGGARCRGIPFDSKGPCTLVQEPRYKLLGHNFGRGYYWLEIVRVEMGVKDSGARWRGI